VGNVKPIFGAELLLLLVQLAAGDDLQEFVAVRGYVGEDVDGGALLRWLFIEI
jgi:hypothetical protein